MLEWALTSAEHGMRKALGTLSRSEGNDLWIMLLSFVVQGARSEKSF